jgi:formate hydrogenlyase subunit 4
MAAAASLLPPLCALLLAPLLVGVINRTKAIIAGRRGPPLLQPYRDVHKALRRGAVYGDVTSWVFAAGPVINLACVVSVLFVMPLGGITAPVAFTGDLVVLVGLLALGRFATVLAALDTGSSFEGMGASREVHFAVLAEPALLLALAALARTGGAMSLSAIYAALTPALWLALLPNLALVAMTLLVLELVENSRIPIDDPTTHLELTMIHEVMVLDHSGPDFAFIQYGAAVKLWLIGSLLVGLVVPVRGAWWLCLPAMLAGMAALGLVIGMIESAMARYRLIKVPQFIVGAATLSAVALIGALA